VTDQGDQPTPSPRQPCPCGSGRRYKACHGKQASRAEHARVIRPFEGLAGEADWIALREIVPAATAELTLKEDGRPITLATVLPMAWPALVKKDGNILLAAQTETASGDASKDIGDALLRALQSRAGESIAPRPLPADAPRIHELIDVDVPPRVVVHSRFDFWLDDVDGDDSDIDPMTKASLERANGAAMPTARLAAVEAAYWMQFNERTQLRWVLPEPEEPLIDALAQLQVSQGLSIGEGSRYLGSYRSLGLLVPVWDLAPGTDVDDVEDEAAAFRERLVDALQEEKPLDSAARRARESLRARQLTMH